KAYIILNKHTKKVEESLNVIFDETPPPSKTSPLVDDDLGYSQNSKAYIVLNKHTKKVKESLNVTFNETPPPSKTSPLVDDDLDEEEAIKVIEKKNLENDIVDETLEIHKIVNFKESRNYSLENVIGNLNQRTLRSQSQNKSYSQNSKAYIILNKHTKKVEESLNVTFDETPPPSKTSPLVDDDLDAVEAIKAIKKKNLENNIVYETLEVDKIVNIKESRNHPLENVIGNLNQRNLRNKLDENSIVSQNKARLVVQGYNQQEGIDYDETYALVARLESIRILLAYACALDFKLFQMDVKSAFLNGFINEEKFGLEDSKPMKTLMSPDTKLMKDEECKSIDSTMYRGMKGLWYHKGTDIETIVYADSDHAGDYVDRKITSGICTFVGCCLTSWFSKKQTTLAISTTKAEYVSAEKACQQALCMKQALVDFDVRLDDVPIMCDNKGAIDLSKNSVQHSRTKHIEIRHHFLHDNVQKGHISIEKVPSIDNITDILTKPLKRESSKLSTSWFRNDGTHSINLLCASPSSSFDSCPCSISCRDNLNTSSERSEMLFSPKAIAKKRASTKASSGKFAPKKLKVMMESSLVKSLVQVFSIVSSLTFVAAIKVGEFVPAITSASAKRLKSFVKVTGGKSRVSKKPVAKKGNLRIRHLTTDALELVVGSSHDYKLVAQQAQLDEGLPALDARLAKIDMEYEEELIPAFKDVVSTKKWVVSKGFRYFLEKFKESDLLNLHLGACVSAAILQGLDNGKEDEAGTLKNPAFSFTSSTFSGGDHFIIALSVPYAGDTGVLNIKVVAPAGVETVETGVAALVWTRLNLAATAIIPSVVILKDAFPFE
nr:retrovirus-related Pol polyprotein from transposon TNT 1-94 [Tanacetum cinerariifolium]